MSKYAPYIFGFTFLVTLGVVGTGVLLSTGYVITKDGVQKGATLTVAYTSPHSTIFINNKERGTVPADSQSITIGSIAPGAQDIIVSHPQGWPWIERVLFETETTYTITPLIIPREPNAITITGNMPGREAAESAFARTALPTGVAPLLSHDGTALVWTDGTSIYARVAGEPITTFAGKEPVRALAWFPNRNDSLIVATGAQVFVIDVDSKTPQNFLPLYTGVAPTFGLDGTGDLRIYIRETGSDTITLLSLGL